MRNIGFFILLLCSFSATAQENTKEIRKEVIVENVNGVQTVEIQTTENGTTTVERYTGEEATRKLEELGKGTMPLEKTVQKSVRLEEIDGKKRLTVIVIENGQVTEEVYEGPDVDRKLKELEIEGVLVPEMGLKEVEIKE
jgi:hypothetical protein